MTTTIVTRSSKGGRLSFTEMDNNFENLKATADAAAPQSTTLAGYGITDAQKKDGDLTAIAGLAGTTGILKKTAATVWELDTNVYQTASDVSAAIQAVVGAAPAALDTLAEIATQLANDESAAASLTTAVSGKVTANTAIVAGTGTKITYDAKGLVTSSTTLSAADIPSLDWTKIGTGKPTTLSGYGITDAQPLDADLTSIAGLAGTTGILKKTAANTWALDTSVYLTANQSISVSGDATGTGTTAITLTLANSGVTAGTYKSVAVDAKGRVTGGTNPTTLSGYGITDAAPLSHTTDVALHLTAAQNTWLDAITATSAEVNYLTGVTSAVQTQLNAKANSASLATVATSGSYVDLTNKPSIPTVPTSVSAFTNDSGFQTAAQVTSAIQAVVGAAPAALDTLAEIATQLANDESAVSALTTVVSGKVTANTAITAGTGTKVTYDAKGLVTGSTTLSATDIPSLDWTKINTGKPTTLSGYGITDAVSGTTSQTAKYVLAAPNAAAGAPTFRALVASDIPTLNQNTTGSAATLTTARSIAMTGDVSWSIASFDGSANVTAAGTLATITDSGTGSFKKITTNSKGLVTGTAAVAQADITGLLGAGSITNTMLANAAVANLSGTNTGDETAATIKTKLGITTLSGSNTGDQTITLTGDATGTGTGSFAVTLANSGVTAGTYKSVTVDTKGRVTGGTNPTTLAGYGITDAASLVTANTWTNNQFITMSSTGAGLAITQNGTGVALSVNKQITSSLATGTAPFAVTSTTVNTNLNADLLDGQEGTYYSNFANLTNKPTTLGGYGITDAYTSAQVDALIQGLDPKASVVVATTANITLSATQTIDGIAVIAGDRVLVKNQTTTSQNGIYVVGAATWTRAIDMSIWSEVPGAYVFVEKGTTYADTGWVCTSDQGGTIDSTAVVWSQFAGAGSVTAGTGISVSGTQVSLASGVATAGTYKSVTVDTYGRVTAGTNPTTLAGYGITDAAPLSHTTDAALHLTTSQNTWIDAITATSAEVNYLSGVTSAIQTQINGKQASNANLTSVAALSTASTGLVKFTNGVASLDSSAYLTGNQTVTVSGDATGSGTTAITLTLAASGVTAGTYKSVTVDAKGRVTSGTNPTTLAGYGITDALVLGSAVGAALGTASAGVATTAAKSDHVHPLQTTVSGNAGTATKLASAVNINGVAFDGSAAITINAVDSTARIASSLIGAINGVASLDSTGKVPSAQLPSYVDDVLEYINLAGFPVTGTAGIIYVAQDTNKIYRWSGTAYIEISPTAGNADTATKLATARSIGMTGDVSWSIASFDGSANVTAAGTLATITDSGTGTFKKITTNSKGLVTGTAAVAQADITGLLGAGSITNAMLVNAAVAILSGTNSGDETAATIKTKLGITTLSGNNTGDQTITLTGDVTGTGTGSFAVTLANSGVTAGTYKSVTVDAKGRVTGGTNPTTLAGYGITDAVALTGAQTLTNKTVTGLKGTKVAIAASAIDLATGDIFSKTITGATTFTVSNVAASGTVSSFILDLTNGGAFAVTWWAGIKWVSGTVPSLTSAGRDLLGFFTHDGGTTWNGLVLGKDVK